MIKSFKIITISKVIKLLAVSSIMKTNENSRYVSGQTDNETFLHNHTAPNSAQNISLLDVLLSNEKKTRKNMNDSIHTLQSINEEARHTVQLANVTENLDVREEKSRCDDG